MPEEIFRLRYSEFNSFDIAWVNRTEYPEKIREVVRWFWTVLLCMLFVEATAFFAVSRLVPGVVISEYLALRLGFATVPDLMGGVYVILFAAALINTLFSFFFSAMAANILSKPVNPIYFARHAVINRRKGRGAETKEMKQFGLECRYFIRMVDGEYLHDLDCGIEIARMSHLNKGYNMTEALFSYHEYLSRARGVRYVRVPLDTVSESGEDTLGEVLGAMYSSSSKDADIVVRFRITGYMPDGTIATRIINYSSDYCLDGYEFVSIRESTLNNRSIPAGTKERIYFNHFQKVYKMEDPPCFCGGEQNVHEQLIERGKRAPDLYDRLRNAIRRV